MQDMPFLYQHCVVDSLMSLFSYKHFSEGQMFAGEGPQKVEKEAGWTGMHYAKPSQ